MATQVNILTPLTEEPQFSITPDEIYQLLSPPDKVKYQALGGLEEIARLLKTDVKKGLKIIDNSTQAVVKEDSVPVIVTQNEQASAIKGFQAKRRNSIIQQSKSKSSSMAEKMDYSPPDNVEQRIAFFGTNKMPEPISSSILDFILDTLSDKILIMLCVAAVVEISIGIYEAISHKNSLQLIDGFAVLAAVLIVVTVTALSDYQKQGQFKKLNDVTKSLLKTKVIRNGNTIQVHNYELLVGDVCIIDTGDVIPADGVLIKGYNIATDESALTGEPLAINKDTIHDPFLLSGTKVTQGIGRMLVIATGVNSLNGRSILALQVEPEKTPLQEKLGVIADIIAKYGISISCIMVVILLIAYLSQNDLNYKREKSELSGDILAIIISGITLIVVAVPEGLPLAVTLALAHATVNMLKDNNLVRHLKACETMGNATTICSDKTGTLTMNQMTVVKAIISSREFTFEDLDEEGSKQKFKDLDPQFFHKLFAFISFSININSTAAEQVNEKNEIVFAGSKTEIALLQATNDLGFPYVDDREKASIAELYPFSSETKSMSTVVKSLPDAFLEQNMGLFELRDGPFRHWIFVKGAAEIIYENCSHYLDTKGQVKPIDKKHKEEIAEIMKGYNQEALRTICVAFKSVHRESKTSTEESVGSGGSPPKEDLKDLVLACLFGILDPLRKEVPDAVQVCQRAGIVVRMVTGDSVATARAIARDCGILTDNGILMEGPEFRKLTPEQMDEILPRLQVLARSSPIDKQVLVNGLKRLKETVAVTGDGTNDAPALTSADVGFSMGIAGTEVAKEASDIVLLDDNFASLVKAVIWGRSVYDSVRKFLQFQLTVNVSAVVLVFVTSMITAFTGSKVPVSGISAIQLLWVNLIMDTMAALALATDPPTPELLQRKPSKRTEHIISVPMAKMIVGQGLYQIAVCMLIYLQGNVWFRSELSHDDEVRLTSALMFNTFVFCQIFNELNCRSITNDINIFRGILKNYIFGAVIVITLVLQVIIIEFGGVVFKIIPGGLEGYEWLACILFGSGSLFVGLLIRQIPDVWFTCLQSKYSAETLEEEGKSPQGEMKLIQNQTSHPIGAKQSSSHSLKSIEKHGRVKSLWKQVIGKTQMQVRVVRAFREPLPVGSSPRIIRSLNQGKSSNPYKSRESIAVRTSSSQPPIASSSADNLTGRSGGIVEFVRGGRSKASDYVALQVVDVNSARMNK